MTDSKTLIAEIEAGKFDAAFAGLYGKGEGVAQHQRRRYAGAIQAFEEQFGEGRAVALFSTPGRTELGGNHTDHNNGIVLAAGVNLDIIAVVAKNDENVIRVKSYGFEGVDEVGLNRLEPSEAEFGRSFGLIRGVATGLARRGGSLGGFDAYTTSDVLKGSGLSSSAAFEVCMASVLNGLYNEDRFTPVELAQVSQYAENVFFGKPSGLMDQTACAVGSVVSIDFADPEKPVIEKIGFELGEQGYHLVITDTKGDHAGLTADYAAIREEMEAVAARFGKPVLRQVKWEDFLQKLPEVRKTCGDRATLRAIHFFEECRRAKAMADSLKAGQTGAYLELVKESGHSSFEYNQNAYSPAHPQNQEMAIGLALSQTLLTGQGAWRLQGGGFAGTIQAYVPEAMLAEYCGLMDSVFGEGAALVLNIRGTGCTRVEAS